MRGARVCARSAWWGKRKGEVVALTSLTTGLCYPRAVTNGQAKPCQTASSDRQVELLLNPKGRNMKKYLAFLSISALLLTSACSATVGDDGAVDGTGTDDATVGADTTTDAGSTDAGSTDAGSVTAGYKSVVIWDKYTEPDCKATTGPGPDIDMVAVWRGNDLLGVGKPGTCTYKAGTTVACPDNQHAAATDVAAACGPFGDLDFKSVSFGYLSLGGGSVEMAIGACTKGGTDIEACDGAGDVVEIKVGDSIDVYEVDQWYLGKAGGNTKAYITGACKCIPETYEVELRVTAGVDTGSLAVGQKTGTGTLDVK